MLRFLRHLRSQAEHVIRCGERFTWHPRVEALETRLLLTINEFPVHFGAEPLAVAAGPDGNIYFAEWGTSSIGVMDTSGHVLNEFAVPTANLSPGIIVAGPDGNMWFTEDGRFPTVPGKIASISTNGLGTITEYALATPNNAPTDVTVGPDNNIWFAEPDTNQVARLDLTTFAVTEFPVPSGRPWAISTGPDGNLWLTEPNANKLAMLDVRGGTFGITEFTVPTPNSQPWGIAAGPDGNVWFTEQNLAYLTWPAGPGALPSTPSPSTRLRNG